MRTTKAKGMATAECASISKLYNSGSACVGTRNNPFAHYWAAVDTHVFQFFETFDCTRSVAEIFVEQLDYFRFAIFLLQHLE